jgi:menaquinol-cytochrome c reductase iron-sulfur subunit
MNGTPVNRRGFAINAIYGLSSIIAAALGLPAFLYLFLPPRVRKQTAWVDAGNLGRLDVNQPAEVTFRRNSVDGWKVTSVKENAWVVKTSENEVVAFSPWCTHLGCAYHWEDRKRQFVCPCHDSTFDLSGNVVTGPAPRPLDRFPVKLEGKEIWLGPVRKV